jgi:hypothetical protein
MPSTPSTVLRSTGNAGLEQEIQRRQALICSWAPNDWPQCRALLIAWKEHVNRLHRQFLTDKEKLHALHVHAVLLSTDASSSENDQQLINQEIKSAQQTVKLSEQEVHNNTLLYFYNKIVLGNICPDILASVPMSITTALPMFEQTATMGMLLFDLSQKIILVVRKNERLGLTEDIWCSLFPNELQDESSFDNQSVCYETRSFGAFLASSFPQLQFVEHRLKTVVESKDPSFLVPSVPLTALIMVKYCAHRHESLTSTSTSTFGTSIILSLPTATVGQCYQTIGTLATPVDKILPRLSTGLHIHDFVLEIL